LAGGGGDDQHVVTAEQQVQLAVLDARGGEVQGACDLSRCRVDDLEGASADRDDPPAVGLHQVGLVDAGGVVVRAGVGGGRRTAGGSAGRAGGIGRRRGRRGFWCRRDA